MLSAVLNRAGHLVTVHAADERHLVKPDELDIYNEPPEPEQLPESHSFIYRYVSAGREGFSNTFPGILRTHEMLSNVRSSITGIAESITGLYRDTINNPFFLMKPAAVILAGGAGALMAGKGKRPLKRTLFVISYGGTAAVVVNPQRALEIATTSYYHTAAIPSVIRHWLEKDDQTVTERVLKASSEAIDEKITEEKVLSELGNVEGEAADVKPEPEIPLQEEVTSEETLKEEPVDTAGTEDIAVEIAAIEDIAEQPTDSLIVDASESGGAEVVEETSSIEEEVVTPVEIEADILAEYVVVESSELVTETIISAEMVEESLPEATEATVFSETEVVQDVIVEEPSAESVAAEPVDVEPVVVEPVAVEPVAVEPVQAEPETDISSELVDDAIVEPVDSSSLPENEIVNEEPAVEVSDLPVIVESSELLSEAVASEELVETSLPETSDATTSTETEITDVAVQESIISPSEGEVTAEVIVEELPAESVRTESSQPDEAAEIIIEQSNEVESLTSNETPELKENLSADNNIDCDEKTVIEIIDIKPAIVEKLKDGVITTPLSDVLSDVSDVPCAS